MMKLWIRVVCLGWLVLSAEAAMDSPLLESMERAVKRDHRIKAIEAELQEADELIAEASGVYYPTVRGHGATGWVENEDDTVRDGNKRLIGLEVTQNLWSAGRNEAGVSYALSHVKVIHASLRRVVNEVSVEVADAWLEVTRVAHVLALYREYSLNITHQLLAAEEKSRVGVGRVTDVRLIRARLRQIEAEQRRVEAEQLVALQGLQRLVGRLPEQSIDRWPQQGLWTVPADIAVHVDLYALPRYQEQQFELEKAMFDLDLQRAERRVSLDLEGSVARGTFGTARADNSSVMLMLSVPIYEGGILRSRERSAQKRVEQVRQQLEDQEAKILLSVQNHLAIWQGNEEVVVLMESAVEAEQEAVEGVQQEVEAGNRPLLDQLKADEELVQRKIELIGARYRQWLSRFQLLLEISTTGLHRMGES